MVLEEYDELNLGDAFSEIADNVELLTPKYVSIKGDYTHPPLCNPLLYGPRKGYLRLSRNQIAVVELASCYNYVSQWKGEPVKRLLMYIGINTMIHPVCFCGDEAIPFLPFFSPFLFKGCKNIDPFKGLYTFQREYDHFEVRCVLPHNGYVLVSEYASTDQILTYFYSWPHIDVLNYFRKFPHAYCGKYYLNILNILYILPIPEQYIV